MRQLASRYLARERAGHTLQTTALVHEAWVRLVHQERLAEADRTVFLGAAARAMRRILVDYARRRRAAKRGGAAVKVPMDEALALYEERSQDLLALDEALTRLGAMDADLARIVELRFFGGLTEEEAAAVLGVSARSVRRGWRAARAWLAAQLTGDISHET